MLQNVVTALRQSSLGEDFLRRLLAAGTVGSATQAAVDAVREALALEVSWSGIVSGEYLTMAGYSGLRTAEMTALWRLKVGQGVGGRVAKEGRTIAVRDYRHDPRRVPVMKTLIDDEGIRAAICAPFVSGTDVLGVLYAAERGTRDWSAEEVQLVTGVAHDTGVALARIRDQHRDRQRAEDASRALALVRAAAAGLVRGEDAGPGIGVLAHHLGMRVELLAPGGAVLREASPGTPPEAPVRLQVDVGEPPLGALRVSGERALTAGERELVEVSGHVVALQLLRERAALQTELRVHGEFLEDLLEGRLEDRDAILARAALLGVDLKAPRYVACAGLHGDGSPAITRRSLDRLERAIRRRFPDASLVPRGGDVVVLLAPGRAEAREVEQALREAVADGLAAGLGRLCLRLDDYADSYAEAAAALDLARRRPQPGEVLTPADLGLYGLLARGSTRQSLESIVAGALGPLLEADAASGSEYVQTLDAYLASDRHLEPTAHRLHVHPNTVRYRLAKVQELLGVSLRDVDDRFLLELALRVHAALDRE
jgi:sugar diacid utilization regulator/putative methionine-R-sulfoxide reductase with GAF domain